MGASSEENVREALDEQAALIKAIKRQLEGDPELGAKGLRDRVLALEASQRRLDDAWATAEREKQMNRKTRTALIAGLGGFGVLNAIIIYALIRILELLSGA